jgi:3'(2'), 5'-bisphosphate nucleotidase
MNGDPRDYRQPAIDIAVEAGERILEIYRGAFSVERKADHSPLTEADLAAHRVIEARLAALTPDIPVVSEESALAPYSERAQWRRFWLVDPLDGTREFVKRNDEFTVNIALVEDRRPVLGVVHVPVAGVTYSAVGGRAWKQTGSDAPLVIQARNYCGGHAIVATSRSHTSEPLARFLAQLRAREGEPEILTMGSALKICLVAEGRADVYARLGPTSEWDSAAGQAVAEAAGGRVVDLSLRPLVYNKPEILNPWFLALGAGGYDWLPVLRDVS